MSKFKVEVTKYITVSFDDSKLDDQFWEEFNSTISDRGGPDLYYLAEHAAWNFVQGDSEFIEGIGPLKEMNISISETGSDVDADCIEAAA